VNAKETIRKILACENETEAQFLLEDFVAKEIREVGLERIGSNKPRLEWREVDRGSMYQMRYCPEGVGPTKLSYSTAPCDTLHECMAIIVKSIEEHKDVK
jgi:hypothetical protein